MKSEYFENIVPNDFVENKMATAPSGMPVMPRIYPENTHLYESTKAKWIDPASGYIFQTGTIEFKDLRTGKTYTKANSFFKEDFEMFDSEADVDESPISDDGDDIEDDVAVEDEESESEDKDSSETEHDKKHSPLEDDLHKILNTKSFDEAKKVFEDCIRKLSKSHRAKIEKVIKNIENDGSDLLRLQIYANNCIYKMKKMGIR